jgi:serine/threonine protein phosphatase PrpC
LVRVHNEDAWHADSSLGLAMVADGVGGHANGAVASQSAVRWISAYVRRVMARSKGAVLSERAQQERTLGRAIAFANKRLVAINAAAGDAKDRCGTTIVGLWAPHGTASAATVFHVGDSRMYLLRKNARLQALTRDHSAYQQWLDSGRRGSPPPKSYILQALGLSDVAPDIITIDIAAGDRFLLCTDGLSNGVEALEMQEVMAESASLETACERFISLGLARGGNDNLTSVVGALS